MNIKDIPSSLLDRERYNKLFYSSPVATPFHSLDFLEVLQRTFPGRQLRFAVVTFDDASVAILPYFTRKFPLPLWMFSPLSVYSGFIYDEKNKSSLRDYLVKRTFSRLITKIVVYDDDLYQHIPYLIGSGAIYATWFIDTRLSYDSFLEMINAKTRNQIKKSQKCAVAYKKIETTAELLECKQIYALLVHKHHIRHPYPGELFDNLFIGSRQGEYIDFKVATYENRVIAYSVFLRSKSEVFYWLNASIPEYAALNATTGLLATTVRFCCEDPCIGRLNLGAVPVGNDGLMHFKKNWGAQEKKYGYYASRLRRLKEVVYGFMGKAC